jgi:Uma2 family endonuclease
MAIQRRLDPGESSEPGRDDLPEPHSAPSTLPPLENGDRLTRAEFERRYEAMPHLKKAELIEGVVYVGSPVRHDQHGQPDNLATTWVGTYQVMTAGTTAANNTTVRLDLDNEPQPDVLLRLVEGGRSRITEDGYVVGAPELVIEVAASTASYDLHDKLRAYRRNSVQEYIVWRVLQRAVDWFALHDGTYERLKADETGIIRSEVFPGLWLNVTALLGGAGAQVLATLQEGLASPEHAAFVERLQSATREQAQQPGA